MVYPVGLPCLSISYNCDLLKFEFHPVVSLSSEHFAIIVTSEKFIHPNQKSFSIWLYLIITFLWVSLSSFPTIIITCKNLGIHPPTSPDQIFFFHTVKIIMTCKNLVFTHTSSPPPIGYTKIGVDQTTLMIVIWVTSCSQNSTSLDQILLFCTHLNDFSNHYSSWLSWS